MREQHALNTGRKGTELAARGSVRRLVLSTGHRSKALNESQWHERKMIKVNRN